MKYAFIIIGIILAAMLAAIPSAAAEDMQGVSYTITPAGGTDEYRIDIQISNITAGGLSLEFPGSFEIIDTNIPDGNYGSDGETLIVTLTGEKEIYLDVVCQNLATGEILEIWEDLAAGTKGGDELSVSESEEEQKTKEQTEKNSQSETNPKESPFGFSGILIILSIVIAGLMVKASNKAPRKEDN